MASLERMSVRRKDPRDSDDGSPPLSMLDACDVDMSVRVYCKRAMMQVGVNCGCPILPNSAMAGEHWAEMAWQMGKLAELPNKSQ